MRKIVIGMHAGLAGTNAWEFWEVPESMTDNELSDMAWQCGKEHAEMYGIYPLHEYQDLPDFDENDEAYSDGIEGWWEDYDAKKHDEHTMTGVPEWVQA